MEMKLSERAMKFLKDASEITGADTHHGANDDCPSHMLDLLLNEYEKELDGTYKVFKREFDFLKGVAVVQEDGRSCPGYDRKKALATITNGEWRTDPRTIMSGITCGVITLDRNDAIKLA